MKKTLIILTIAAVLFAGCSQHPVIAVACDPVTAEKASEGLNDYVTALRNDGYRVEMLVRNWKTPDSLKTALCDLNSRSAIEGLVLIGDIPIPMLLDAQHMTSAFKIDPTRYDDFQRIAVASDRFYDDPDLKFDFLMQDSLNPLLFYYSLRPDSPQNIEKDFYSGRIYPPVQDDSRYELIDTYLKKAAAYKNDPSLLDTMLTFAGHGYHSESLNAWEDHSLMLQEQFPDLYRPGGQVKNLNHAMSHDMKDIIMKELQREELDMAIFHAHGGDDVQYLIGYPDPGSARQHIEEVKRFVRSKLRRAKRRGNYDEAKNYYLTNYDIPERWIENTFDSEVIREDSLYSAKLDLWSEDVKTIRPGVECVMFDECYNGQFFKENYISGTYIFGEGSTVAGIANSVNVRQDIWANELLGLLRFGVSLGNWHLSRNYLESHIIGDPTFHFDSESMLLRHRFSSKRLLNSEDPVLRTYGLYRLHLEKNTANVPVLVEFAENDPSANVRLMAHKCLADLRAPEFYEVLITGIHDPNELIRRVCANWMGKTGQTRYLTYLVETYENDHSARASFSAKSSMKVLLADSSDAMTKFIESYEGDSYETMKNRRDYNCRWLYEDIVETLEDTSKSIRRRNSRIRTFRNYNFPNGIPILTDIALNENEIPQLRVTALEALGWYVLNPGYERIADQIRPLQSHDNKIIADEAKKSVRRLMTGPNVSVTP